MRELLAIFLTMQMSFSPLATAADIPPPPPPGEAADPTQGAPVPPPPPAKEIPDGVVPKALECQEMKCSKFFAMFKDVPKAQQLIRDQLGKNNRGRKCQALKEKAFLDKLMAIYDYEVTEANNPAFCAECRQGYHEAIAKMSEDNSKANLRAVAEFTLCHNPDIRPAPPPVPPPPPVVQSEPPPPAAPIPVARPVPVRRAEPVNDGGSIFDNPVAMGIGGLVVGGLLGYMIGKNSGQNQQQYPPMPYWQQMGPRPMPQPFGQVPPMYGGNPFLNRGPMFPPRWGGGGVGGGGAPIFLPYQGYGGQPGYNTGVGVGNYNLGTQFSGGCGFCTGAGMNSPIYNGAPPVYLPAR